MRRETVELVRKAVTENWRAYVLVNHRSLEWAGEPNDSCGSGASECGRTSGFPIPSPA